jgi:predicted nucleic acid-binding protein
MSRVFWDSMLFIYLVEDDALFAPIVRDVLGRCFRRGDSLFTSHLSIAETLVGIEQGSAKETKFLAALREMEFSFVDFGGDAVEPFRRLRREFGLKPPDALNLACAAAIKTDIYLTNDTQLLKRRLHVPGIQFVADFAQAPL